MKKHLKSLFISVVLILAFAVNSAVAANGADFEKRLISCDKLLTRSEGSIEAFLVKNKIPQTQIDEILSRGAKTSETRSIDYYRLVYRTMDFDGNTVKASGLLALPAGVKTFGLVSYQHGTIFNDKEAPSAVDSCSEAEAVASVFALHGYAAVMADYQGLGDISGFHPYFHAKTAAVDCADFLAAVKEFFKTSGFAVDGDRVYLAGFSQGGHVTLALQRHLESPGASSNSFSVAAAAGIAGAYDPYLALRSWMIRPNPISCVVMGRILESYRRIYNINAGTAKIFTEPYDKAMEDMASRGNTLEKTLKLPARLSGFLAPDFMARFSDPNDPMSAALAENQVHKNWKPVAPVTLYHGGADTIVPFIFSKNARERLELEGADVKLINAGEKLGHPDAVIPSCIMARKWFDELRNADGK